MPYEKDGIKYPRCTQIISDCTSKGDAMTQWAANCVVEWIRDNAKTAPTAEFACCELDIGNPQDYCVTEEDLNQARFAYKKVSDKALDVGSQVHAFIELYLNAKINKSETILKMVDKYEKLPGEVQNAFDAFQNWEKDHNLKPIELEKTVYGSRWAGTLDFYGYFDDKLYVIDWKTSKAKNKKTGKGIYPEMRYQVAAYRNATENQIKKWVCNDGTARSIPRGCGVLRLDKETGMPDWNDTSKTYEQDLKVFNRMVDLYFERHPIVAKRFAHLMPF